MTTHPHLAPRLKKEESYISTPPLGLRGLFLGELYLYLLLIDRVAVYFQERMDHKHTLSNIFFNLVKAKGQ